MPTSVTLLKAIRLTHLYVGVFIAPALVFFAFTGAIQTFGLHETARGSDYKPPAILVRLSQMHKNQTLVVPVRKPAPPAATPPAARPVVPPPATSPIPKAPEAPPAKKHTLLPMKLFFLLVALGLFTSTLTGLFMAYKYTRRAMLVTAVLLAGMLVPCLFTLF
jgi:hypothetical protein